MLTEEAHHMFVGETGVGRTIQRTCEAMKQAGVEDPFDVERVRALGVIDLPLIQRKLNLHYTLSLDLFGQEVSSNAANSFNAGVKGRYMESRLDDDHRLASATYPVAQIVDGEIRIVQAPALSAINMRLRDDYTRDAAGGIGRWNKIIEGAGVKFELKLPHEGFNRRIGVFANQKISPEGKFVDSQSWDESVGHWLPSRADGDYIQSLMKPCSEPGQYAGWIAPPRVGIDNKPGDFEYVKLHMA
jgi:benzoyl-CoA 2,3-dioxygenase component B